MACVLLMGTLTLTSRLSAGPQVSQADRSKITSQVEAAIQASVAAASVADAEKTFENVSSSPEFRMADNGMILGNREAALAAIRDGFSQLRSQDIRIADHHVTVLSPDLGMYTAQGTFTSTNKAGKTSAPRSFAWTVLMRREGPRWRMLNVHQSFGPAAEP